MIILKTISVWLFLLLLGLNNINVIIRDVSLTVLVSQPANEDHNQKSTLDSIWDGDDIVSDNIT